MGDRPQLDQATQCSSIAAILDDCLRLEPKDEILVIYDETFLGYSDALLQVIRERSLSATFVCFPYKYQVDLIDRVRTAGDGGSIQLPPSFIGAVQSSSAILNLLNGDLATLPIRQAILLLPRPLGCRLAHIPGISPEVMSIVSVSPIAEILRHSEILAWALGEAEQAEIISWDSAGREHRLALGLGGWDNEPMMSPGVIFPGSWGNVPPGETFCCPNPTSTSGSICIDGSVPGIRLARAEDVILTFEQGKLVRWEAAGRGSPACDFFDKEKTKADLQNDLNWNTIAELGIGLNPAIKDLTGNSLFDEKAQETVHIAIGNNTIFGHSIKSDIHADLVTRRPSLLLDGREVMARGRLNLEDMERDREGRRAVAEAIPPDVNIFLREAKVTFEADGEDPHAELLVRRLFRANRVGIVRMAGPQVSRELALLARELATYDHVRLDEFVRRQPRFGASATNDLLGMLYHYRALGIATL